MPPCPITALSVRLCSFTRSFFACVQACGWLLFRICFLCCQHPRGSGRPAQEADRLLQQRRALCIGAGRFLSGQSIDIALKPCSSQWLHRHMQLGSSLASCMFLRIMRLLEPHLALDVASDQSKDEALELSRPSACRFCSQTGGCNCEAAGHQDQLQVHKNT